MATIANLLVKIGVDNKKLLKGIDKAEMRAKKLANFIRSGLVKAFKYLSVSAAGALTAVAATIKTAMDSLNNLQLMSAKSTVDFKEFQKLAFSAKIAGFEVDRVTDIMEELTKKINEAVILKSGSAVEALKVLGEDAEYLKTLKPEQQLERIMKALSQPWITKGERGLLADELFSGEGQMVAERYFRVLQGDITKTDKLFDDLGLGINDSQSKAMESLSRGWVQVKSVVESIIQKVVATFAPKLREAIDATLDWVKAMGGADGIAKLITDKIKEWTPTIWKFAKNFGNFMYDLFQDIRTLIDYAMAGIEKISSAYDYVKGGVEAVSGTIDAASINVKNVIDSTIGAIKNLPTSLKRGEDESTFKSVQNKFFNDQDNANRAMETNQKQQNNTQKVEITVKANKEDWIEALVNSTSTMEVFNKVTSQYMKDAARGTRR